MLTIADVKPYPLNAKLHDDKQLDLLAKIIMEVGWRQNVEVNQTGVIVAGHGRWLVWEKHKDKLPPIWITDDQGNTIHGAHDTRTLTPDQEAMWRFADNQVSALTGFDMGIAVPELKLLPPEMLDLTGFDKQLVLSADNYSTDFSLPTGDKSLFEQITFTLSAEQAQEIKDAIDLAKKDVQYDFIERFGNENSNGNALFLIIRQWGELKT